jgi:hypothetical protein
MGVGMRIVSWYASMAIARSKRGRLGNETEAGVSVRDGDGDAEDDASRVDGPTNKIP